MVDTARTLAALQALLADNDTEEISPQDVRDFLVSVYGVVETDSVPTVETTTSTAYTDLATPGPAVTVVVPASGLVVVHNSAGSSSSDSNRYALSSVAVSGANTVAADDVIAVGMLGIPWQFATRTHVFTGLAAGSTTFTAKYRSTDGGATASFQRREIVAITMPGIT